MHILTVLNNHVDIIVTGAQPSSEVRQKMPN